MAFLVTKAGEELLADVERFCSQYVDTQSAAWDCGEKEADEARAKMQELGYPMLTLPEELGGLGISPVDAAAVMERIAYADAGLAVSLAGNALAVKAVLAAGNEVQKQTMARILADGGIGAFCLTESQAGSDASNIQTKAALDGDAFVLNGTKLFVTNGGTADFYVVAAVIEGKEKPSLFLIEKNTEGLQRGPEEDKLGIRSCSTCMVMLENCRVSQDSLLNECSGMDAILAAVNEGRFWISAMAEGVAKRALEEAASYAKERIQFGEPIAQKQAVQLKLAEMKIKIEAAQALTEKGLQKMEQGRTGQAGAKEYAAEAAMAKAFAADAAVEVTEKAMEIFGGYGYTKAYPAEKLLRDARAFLFLEGTAEMQKLFIAASI